MGAEFWECYTPYRKDLKQALEEAQESAFNSGSYYSGGSIEDEIEATKKN